MTKNVNKQKQVTILVNDKLTDESLQVAKEFNTFFTKVPDKGPSNPRPQLATLQMRNSPVSSMALAPVTEEEVAHDIQQFPPKNQTTSDSLECGSLNNAYG